MLQKTKTKCQRIYCKLKKEENCFINKIMDQSKYPNRNQI